MNWNDNFGDTSIDEVFNTHAQGNNKKRSSILKQTKKTNIEMFENEETDYRRNRQSMKRVSFAETFQVKELQTGNIYDIPGFNESSQRSSHSVQISHLTESVTNNSEGTFPSRSFVQGSSNVIFKDPTETFTNIPQLNDKAQHNIDLSGRNIPLLPVVPDKKSVRQPNTMKAPSRAWKSVVALLDGTPMVEDKENIESPQDPSQMAWLGSDYLKVNSNTNDDFDLLKESCLKGSQESQNSSENCGILPLETGNTKSSQKADRNLKVDMLNKENILQTSPKFNTLKFIDSPPSWKSVDENILRCPSTALPGKESENQPIGKGLVVSQNKCPSVKGKALMRNPPKGMDIFSEINKENMLPGMKMASQQPPFSVAESISVPNGIENDNLEFNYTRSNVSAMDLTMLPDNLGQDDTLIEPENIPVSNDRAHNKTRLTLCDMEMTCTLDQPVSEEASVSSPKLDVLGGTQCENSLKVSDTSIRSSQQSNILVDKEEGFPASRYASKDSNQNKTRFSNYDMEMTCALDQSDVGDSLLVSSQRYDKFVFPEVPNKTNEMPSKEPIFNKSLRNSQESDPYSRMPPKTVKNIADDNFKFEQDLPLGRCVNEKTRNKTRHSTCDMEMTCVYDQSVVEDSLSDNPDASTESGLDAVFNKDHKKAFEAMESNENVENSVSVSPVRANILGDFGKSNLVRTTEGNILKVFETTDLDKSLKSSQQSNFSFEEMEQLPSSDFINVGDTKPDSDVEKFCRSPMMLKNLEDLQFENNNNCFDGSTSYKVQEEYMLNRLEKNNDLKIGAVGRKYLKFYPDSEAVNFNDRLLTSSPAKDLDSSFTLKNKENLHLNRKRIAHSSNNSAGMALRFQNDDIEVDSLAGSCSKLIPKSAAISKAKLSEDAFDPSSRPENPSISQGTLLFRSEVMELTCHNLSFEEREHFSNSIVEKVQVVTETELSNPDDVFSYGKFKNTRYSTNYMDLTCLPESHNSSEAFDVFQNADAPMQNSPKEVLQVPPYFHLKDFSMTHSNQTNSMNQSVRARQKMFKVITDDFSSAKPSSLTITQESAHNSYFKDKDNSICAYQPRDALVKNCRSTAAISDSCVEVDNFQESTKEGMPCHRVVKKSFSNINSEGIKNPSTPGIVYTIRKIKQTLKESNGNLVLSPDLREALKKKQKFCFKHPYTEMKISSPMVKDCRQNQSFEPESQENSFACLSEEGSRHPFSVGLSSDHKTNSEVQVEPRNTKIKSLCRNIENLSVLVSLPETTLPKVNFSMVSPEMRHSITMSNLNSSKAFPDAANEPEIFPSAASPNTQSLSVPKDNYSMVSPETLRGRSNHSVSYAQVPSITFDDDSFQLLHQSALENSLMDSYSKKFTICLDKSDFVPKESVPVSPPKMDRSAFASNSMIENESMFRPSPKMLREDGIPLPNADEPTMSRKIPFDFPETYKNASTNQTSLDVSHKCEKTSNSSSCDIQPETSEEGFDFAAKLKANMLIFQNLIKSSSVSNSEVSNSPERAKLSANDVPAETGTASYSQLPNSFQDEKVFTDKKNTVNVLEENTVTSLKSVTELSHSYEDSIMVLKEEIFPSNLVKENTLAQKSMIPDSMEVMETEPRFTQKSYNSALDTDVSMIPDSQSQDMNASGNPSSGVTFGYSSQEVFGEENKHLNEDVSMRDTEDPKGSQIIIGDSSNICRVTVLEDTLSIFKEKFEKSFSCERRNWILKNLSERAATFELQWCVFVYGCVLRVEVTHLNDSECSISFTPIGKSMVVRKVDSYLCVIQERGYQYFEYLVRDKVLPFSIYSHEMIVKFTEYAQIVKDVEALMRDMMKLTLTGSCDHSSDLEPVSVTIQGINEHLEHVYDLTFRVDLKTYPRAKIVPEVTDKIRSRICKKDITNDILAACSSVEPGQKYLYRMLIAASELRPPL